MKIFQAHTPCMKLNCSRQAAYGSLRCPDHGGPLPPPPLWYPGRHSRAWIRLKRSLWVGATPRSLILAYERARIERMAAYHD